MIKGIQRYIENIEFYERNKDIILPRKKQVTKTKPQNSFKQALMASINHKQAIENSQKNMENNSKFEPRYLQNKISL